MCKELASANHQRTLRVHVAESAIHGLRKMSREDVQQSVLKECRTLDQSLIPAVALRRSRGACDDEGWAGDAVRKMVGTDKQTAKCASAMQICESVQVRSRFASRAAFGLSRISRMSGGLAIQRRSLAKKHRGCFAIMEQS